jgi:hypothetical protein
MKKRLLTAFSPKTYAVYYKNGVSTFSKNDIVLFKTNSHEEKGTILDFIPESQSILLKTDVYPDGIPINPSNILRKA